MSQLNQQQQQQQLPQSNKNSEQSSRLGSPSQKKVLIYTGQSYLRPSSQQQHNNISSHSPSLLQQNNKSAGKSILKPIRLSIDPDKLVDSVNNVTNYPHNQRPYINGQHSRAQSETGNYNNPTFSKPSVSYLVSPDNQFVSPPKTEKKHSGFIQLQNSMNTTHRDVIQPKIQLNAITTNTNTPNTLNHNSNRQIEPNKDNSPMLVLSPLRQKNNKNSTGDQNSNTRNDSAMIPVNDRIPFKVNNGVSLLNKGNQEVLPLKDDQYLQTFNTKSHYNNMNNNTSIIDNTKNNNYNYKVNNSNNIQSNGHTLSSDGDKQTASYSIQNKDTFQHTGSYLKRRLQQIDQNQFKPINQLPLVNEDTTAETTINPSDQSFAKNNNNHSQICSPIVTQFRVDPQEQNSPQELTQASPARNQSSIINQPQERAQVTPSSASSNGTSLISSRPTEYGTTKMLPPNPPFPFPPTRRLHSQSDQGRHPYGASNDSFNGNNIIPTDAEVNRRKHRLLERLRNPNSPPNKFHYSEHYQDQTEDEIANLNSPPGITHPLRNLYDHKNPLRMFQIRNNIPLANQKIIADPETYTHQLFCHANVKRQKNQERVINLLEEQDQMMGRLIGKYKKRADQEEVILAKKLDQLEKEKNSLVHLKIQEHKLGQLQHNLTSKLGQFKQNVGFYNNQIQPSIPALRPDMYDQCSDMYDLAFLDSILRQDQKRFGRVKQRQGLAGANTKNRSKSVLE